MRAPARDCLLPKLALGALGIAMPAGAMAAVGSRTVTVPSEIHFFGVGMTAAAAAAASVVLTLIGARFRDTRTVLVGTAFAVMAALLGLHGLATPGFLFPVTGYYGVIKVTGGATLPVGAAILALSAVKLPARLRGVKPLLLLQAALLVVVIGLGAAGLASPELIPPLPAPNSPLAISFLAAGLALFALLITRALRTFLLTRRGSDLLVVVGLSWLATALFGALTMTAAELGWWLGHMFELDGILAVGIPVALDLARTTQSRPLAGDLHAADLVLAEEYFLGSHVRAMTLRLAQKDEYTEQHTRRVALRAVQVGEELGLSRRRLRELAIGGLIHDIGKLSVPDAILKKPGALEDDEYDVIKRHAEWGTRLVDELGSFSAQVRALVGNHHERLDGKGYPKGLTAEHLDLGTRIISVCDVYDALISARVYRPAWPHERAMALLREESGTAFDPRCVQALERVLERELESVPAPDPSPSAAGLGMSVPAPA